MKHVTRHPRIVEALIDSDVTIKGQRFVEYFNNMGVFYPEDSTPTGIGIYFQKEGHNDWIEAGKVKIIDTIHYRDTQWWTIKKDTLLKEIGVLLEERRKIQSEIDNLERILFDPITNYNEV